MRCAPTAASSAGWKSAITVPAQSFRVASRIAIAPSSELVWWSWPQACIVGTRWPSALSWECFEA